jgi:RNA polymerase sigma-70 factor (ECF subfamily)
MAANKFASAPSSDPTTRLTLLGAVKEPRNHDAWRRFVDLYSPVVLRYCRRYGMQDADIRDVAQNVFLVVSQALPRFQYRPDRGRFRSWFGTVAYREIRRHFRRRRYQSPCSGGNVADLEQAAGTMLSEWITDLEQHLFECALDRVRACCRRDVWEAFQRTWMEHHPTGHVARQLGHSPQWVYKARFQVLTQLRQEVESLGDDVAVLSGRA